VKTQWQIKDCEQSKEISTFNKFVVHPKNLIASYKNPHERVFIASFIFPHEIYIDFRRKLSLFAGLFSVSILTPFFLIGEEVSLSFTLTSVLSLQGRGGYFYP